MHRGDEHSGTHGHHHHHHHGHHGHDHHDHDHHHHHHEHDEHHHEHLDVDDWESYEPWRIDFAVWRRRLFVLFVFVIAAILVVRSVVFVDETEYVYVTLFGKPVRLLTQPGLAFKWPFETVRRLDRRLQVLNPPGREMLTKGGARRAFTIGIAHARPRQGVAGEEALEVGQNLNVEWFACWRLPTLTFAAKAAGVDPGSPDARRALQDAVLRYLRAVGTVEAAEARLEDRIWSLVRAEVGAMSLDQFVNLDPKKVQLADLAERITAEVRQQAFREYGIEVVDVRIKRFNHPTAVRSAIYDMIRTERQAVADRTRAEGKSIAETIRSQADREVREIIARADREAAEIRAKAEAEAMKLANQAHAQDPAFYEFLVTLDTYRKVLNERTTLILSSDSPLLKLLTTVRELASGGVIGKRTEAAAQTVPATGVAADGGDAAGGNSP